MINSQSTVRVAPDPLQAELYDELAILHLGSGTYYGLEEVGADVWRLLQQPIAVGAIRDALLAEYEVEPAACERDLLVFLKELEAAGLIEVC